jgi:hypothetical protein
VPLKSTSRRVMLGTTLKNVLTTAD